MKKLLLIAVASLAISACQTTSPGTGVEVSTGVAPLSQTDADNKAILYALESADTIASLVDLARDSGKLVKGTPKAQTVAGYLRQLASALRAASAAQKLGDTGTVNLNLDQARDSVRLIREILKVDIPE